MPPLSHTGTRMPRREGKLNRRGAVRAGAGRRGKEEGNDCSPALVRSRALPHRAVRRSLSKSGAAFCSDYLAERILPGLSC